MFLRGLKGRDGHKNGELYTGTSREIALYLSEGGWGNQEEY